MSRIKGKDTTIEVMVRKFLFKKGLRFRKNVKELPGKPDIVLKKYNTVIFVHGCFWHRHENCPDANLPKTKTDFWTDKLNKNVIRDKENIKKLTDAGWEVIVIWECQLSKKNFEVTMNKIYSQIIR